MIYFKSLVLLVLCSAHWMDALPARESNHGPQETLDIASVARSILSTSDWASVATISTQDDIKGYPFVSLKSVSDGPSGNATGIPYFYLTSMDVTAIDLNPDNRASVLTTQAEGDFCQTNYYDAQDPRCGKLFLTGKITKVNESDPEFELAKSGLFEKHPSMIYWPSDHGFYVAKLNIESISVLAHVGGVEHVSVEDYFNANTSPKK